MPLLDNSNPLYLGTTQITRAYLGSTLVYEYTPPTGGGNIYDEAVGVYSMRRLVTGYTGALARTFTGGSGVLLADGSGDITVSEIETVAAGGSLLLTHWYDQSGNANDLTQPTGTGRPAIADNGSPYILGQRPALRFDPSSGDKTMDALMVEGNVFEVFIVFRNLATTPKRREIIHMYRDGTISGCRVSTFGGQSSFGQTVFTNLGGNDNTSVQAAMGAELNNHAFGNVLYKDSDQYVRIKNRNIDVSNIDTIALLTASSEDFLNRIIVGDDNTGNNEIDELLQEIIIFPRELSQLERDAVVADQQAYYEVLANR